MLAKKTLNTDIIPLKAKDSIAKAKRRMEKLEVHSLPVVDSATRKLVGQISLKAIHNLPAGTMHISDMELEEAVKVYERQHIFEAVRLMLLYEMRLIPVVDDEWTYLGIVRKQEVLEALTGMLNLAEHGSIITVELQQRDFTLSEIVHLIEVEDAKILGITVETPDVDKDVFEISVKLNLKDVSRIVAALRRYGYTIVAESGSEVFGMDLENRADELIKYLDM